MPVTELYAFNLICENLMATLCGVALSCIKDKDLCKIGSVPFILYIFK